jgi:hypothetical protein
MTAPIARSVAGDEFQRRPAGFRERRQSARRSDNLAKIEFHGFLPLVVSGQNARGSRAGECLGASLRSYAGVFSATW